MVQPCWQKHQEEQHHRRTCKGWTLYRPATMWCWLPCWVGVGMIKMMIHFCEHDYIITRNDFHRLSPKYASRLKKVCLHCPEPGRFVVVVDNLSQFWNWNNTSFFSISPESLLLRLKSHLRRRIEKSVSVKQSRFIVKQPKTTCTNEDNLEKGNSESDELINVICGNLFGSSWLGYE